MTDDYTMNTIITGYDALSRVIDAADRLNNDEYSLFILADSFEDWIDYGYPVVRDGQHPSYSGYDAVIIECTDSRLDDIQEAIDAGLLVIGYVKGHGSITDMEELVDMFDEEDVQ